MFTPTAPCSQEDLVISDPTSYHHNLILVGHTEFQTF